MMAGAGFDANVVVRVSLPLKKRLGPHAYVWQAAVVAAFTRTLGRLHPSPSTARAIGADGSAVACNGRRYGGPFVAAPGRIP